MRVGQGRREIRFTCSEGVIAMPTCPHCGTESRVGTKFCPECGTEIPSPRVSRLNARGIDLVSLLSLVPYAIRAVWREFVAAWRKQGSWGKVILGLLVVTLLWCQLASMARLFLGAPSRVSSPTVTGRPRVMIAEEVATATPRPTYTVYPTYTPYPTRPSPGSFASASPSLTITPKRAVTPTFTPEPATPTSTPHCDLGAAFVRDVTIPDNTGIEPGTKFTKTWGLRNSGTCHWGDEVRLKHVDGERMAKSEWVSVPRTMAGESAEVSVEMQAPKEVGTYKGAWRMCTEQGECFGDVVYVQIVVQAPTPTSAPTSTRSPREALQGYIDLINSAGLGPYIATVGYDPYLPDPNEIVITVRNSWHYEPKQVRLQAAQDLWKIWATGFCPAEGLDSCRIELTDQNGNRVGGSSWLAGSIVKVQD